MVFSRIKKSKRIIMLIAVCFCALLLTGCGATLSVYDYTEDGVRYHMYELSIDNETKDSMERSAINDVNGNKYTVQGYFARLFADYDYTLVSASNTDGKYVVRYRKQVTDGGELAALGTKVDFTTTHTENPFIRTYTATSANPFNGVRENYDNVQPLRSSTVLERIKNGAVARNEHGDTVVSLHAIDEAFPYLKSVNPDGLLLNYVRYGSDRMESSGSKISTDKGTAYVFSRYFDDSDTYIQYNYKGAVPYGWYMVAIAAGALVFGLIILITRTKKQKPTLLDRFPYNPEQYRDYDSNLPSKLN
ncbi:MAG: hypothetical protein K2J01_06180 [Clostridiales bacterium]|nr:hypothetical protein [Clostridiales bacterium]